MRCNSSSVSMMLIDFVLKFLSLYCELIDIEDFT